MIWCLVVLINSLWRNSVFWGGDLFVNFHNISFDIQIDRTPVAYHVALCCCSLVLQVHSFAKSHFFFIRMWPVSLLCLTGPGLTQSKQNYEIQYTNLWCVLLGLWHGLHISKACHLCSNQDIYFSEFPFFIILRGNRCVNCRHDTCFFAMSSLHDAHFCFSIFFFKESSCFRGIQSHRDHFINIIHT